MTNPIKKLAGQTVVYGFSNVVGRLLVYLLVPLYTRLFEPEAYGIVSELYAYVVFLLVLLTYGMETAFFRYSELNAKTRTFSTAMISVLVTGILFLVVAVSFSGSIAVLLDYPDKQQYVVWFAVIVVFDVLSALPYARLRQENKALRFAGIKLLNIFMNVGLNLFFFLLCPYLLAQDSNSWVGIVYDPSMGIAYIFISNMIASGLSFILLLPEVLAIREGLDRELWRKLLAYGLPLLVVGMAGAVNEVVDRVLLKYLLPAASHPLHQLGIYSANYKLAVMMTIFIQTFRYAAEPFFFAQAKEKNAPATYARVMTYFVIFGLFIFMGIMFYIDIVRYFIDSDYHSGLKIVPVLLLANLFLGIIYNLSVWYKLTNKTRYGAYIALLGAGVTILLNVLFIPVLGYMASAWATFACYFTMMLLSYFWGRRVMKIPYDLKKAGLYFFLTLGLFIIERLVDFELAWMNYLFNSLLLFFFVGFVFVKERIYRFIFHIRISK